MCAWCRYTQGRFERTHGHVLNGHTTEEEEGHRQFCLPKFAHTGLSRDPEVHQKVTTGSYKFKFESRSSTTRARFLQSLAFPDKAVQFQLS